MGVWTMNEEFSNIIREYEGITELTDEEKQARKIENDSEYYIASIDDA